MERVQHAMVGPSDGQLMDDPILIRQTSNYVPTAPNLGFPFPKFFPYDTGL